MALKRWQLGVVFMVGLVACGTTFPYKWYGTGSDIPYTGTLLGEKPKDDLPFANCEPTEGDKGKCVILFRDEFQRLREKYVELQERLKDCEQSL